MAWKLLWLARRATARRQEILDFAAGYDGFTLTDDPMVAAKDADVVITDVWTSMGQEEERAAREKAFAGYCIDEKIMGVAKSDAIVQHCLPAHRGEEITEEVFEANAGPIFDEAENPFARTKGRYGYVNERLIVQNAVFSHGVLYLPFEKLCGIIKNRNTAHDMCVK